VKTGRFAGFRRSGSKYDRNIHEKLNGFFSTSEKIEEEDFKNKRLEIYVVLDLK